MNKTCQNDTISSERDVLLIALILNAIMFVVGLIAGILAQSTGLIADSLDMLADTLAYSIGLYAIGRSSYLKSRAAILSGCLLLILGFWVLIEVIRRAWLGSFPEFTTMIVISGISLLVNVIVLKLLGNFKNKEVHLRAVWVFTRADVVANIGVIISGVLVAITASRYPDLIVGFAIALYVIKEAFEIIGFSRES